MMFQQHSILLLLTAFLLGSLSEAFTVERRPSLLLSSSPWTTTTTPKNSRRNDRASAAVFLHMASSDDADSSSEEVKETPKAPKKKNQEPPENVMKSTLPTGIQQTMNMKRDQVISKKPWDDISMGPKVGIEDISPEPVSTGASGVPPTEGMPKLYLYVRPLLEDESKIQTVEDEQELQWYGCGFLVGDDNTIQLINALTEGKDDLIVGTMARTELSKSVSGFLKRIPQLNIPPFPELQGITNFKYGYRFEYQEVEQDYVTPLTDTKMTKPPSSSAPSGNMLENFIKMVGLG